MAVSVGDRIPDATLVKIAAEGPQPVSTADFFAGRTVALFAVPGAFTPTCSAKHLPGFVEHAQALKDKGIDEIAHLAQSGRTSIPVDTAIAPGLYRAAGFRVCGGRAVRVDILERL
ncbi:MAG: redoxin family protein, partial [Thermaurantiacus sp.]